MQEVKIGEILYLAMIKGENIDFEVLPGEVICIRKEGEDIWFYIKNSWNPTTGALLEYRLSDIGTKMFRTRKDALLSLKNKILNTLEEIINEMAKGNSKDD